MPALLADENVHRDIVRGLQLCLPDLDLVRVQDAGLRTIHDPMVLRWAAEHGYVLLTHDRRTMPAFAHERVRRGERMPGVLVVSDRLTIGRAIEEVVLVLECSREDEWDGQVRYLPL